MSGGRAPATAGASVRSMAAKVPSMEIGTDVHVAAVGHAQPLEGMDAERRSSRDGAARSARGYGAAEPGPGRYEQPPSKGMPYERHVESRRRGHVRAAA